jgi:guanylate kinase
MWNRVGDAHPAEMRGPLVILSGPSGSGKSTVIQRLLADPPGPLRLSVSATTRRPREGEKDGVDYHFWTKEQFEKELAAKAFLEHATVHGSDYYGTLRTEVEPYLARGIGVVLVIDVQGAEQVRLICPNHVSVFLKAPSMAEYERRLRARGAEDEATISRRLETARDELDHAPGYQYQIINDDLARATAELRQVVAQEFERTRNAG